MRHIAALLLIGLAAAGCGTGDRGTVEGLITSVEGDLTTVESFSVLTDEGVRTFTPSPEGDYAFPLSHLRDHLRSGEPVVVFWEARGGADHAIRLDDADPEAH